MRDRPIYIGLACWFLIILGTWQLITCFSTFNSNSFQREMKAVPLPIPMQVTQYGLSIVVPLVCAGFMTEGANWARVLYITWGIINYLIEAIYVPDKTQLLPGLPIFAVVSILLLLPRARGYFLLPRHHS